jgi:putative ABC transport system ATP-binding protein
MTAPIVEVRDLWRVYAMGEDEVAALRGVCCSVERGEWVAVMGASGSGKSTFLNILGCLDQPTRGSYRLAGRETASLSPDERAKIRSRELGFVFQSFQLIPRTTALENVELPLVYGDVPASEHRGLAKAALEAVGLVGREHFVPSQLSGGQQQRVAIARALIQHPQLLLADEPTGNLDTKTSVEILEIFRRLHQEQQLTIVMVTHEADVAAYAGRVLSFRDGEIISDVRRSATTARAEQRS